MKKRFGKLLVGISATLLACSSCVFGQGAFHGAPDSAEKVNNPYAGQAEAAQAGKAVYSRTCAKCHGASGAGSGNVPPLANGPTQQASDGAIFWYITKGDVDNGMPAWGSLAEEQRWQVVTFVKSLKAGAAGSAEAAPAAATTSSASTAPPPKAPFTDYRYEKPGTVRKIRPEDLPQPYASQSASNGPKVVERPANAWPQALPGFKVELYATGLTNPRIIRVAPNGDYFLAETTAGDIKIFRGITAEGKPGFGGALSLSQRRPGEFWSTAKIVRLAERRPSPVARYRLFSGWQEDVYLGWVARECERGTGRTESGGHSRIQPRWHRPACVRIGNSECSRHCDSTKDGPIVVFGE
jgi:mono/diheme cytochrome c family protein